jgi:hypothetical protein
MLAAHWAWVVGMYELDDFIILRGRCAVVSHLRRGRMYGETFVRSLNESHLI